jgi:hypothetical protein
MKMIRTLIVIGLVACTLAQTLWRGTWVVQYHVNKAAYIAICENLDRPELNCEGQCKLKKELRQISVVLLETDESSQTNTPPPVKEKGFSLEFAPFILTSLFVFATPFSPFAGDELSPMTCRMLADRLGWGGIFHPPAAV